MDFERVDIEAPSGSFSADIRATDTNGNSVIIENQLEGPFSEPLVWKRTNRWKPPWILVYGRGRIDYSDGVLIESADWVVGRGVRFSKKPTPIVRELAAEIDNETPDPELGADTD